MTKKAINKTTTPATAAAAAPATDAPSDDDALSSAPPHPLVVAVWLAMVAMSIQGLPSLASLDEVATAEILTRRLIFGSSSSNSSDAGSFQLTVFQLGLIRLFVAAIVFGTTLYCVFVMDGWEFTVPYLPQSRLKRAVNRLSGWRTQMPFTSWSWNLLGFSFLLNATICFLQVSQQPTESTSTSTSNIPVWLLRAALIAWEIAAPCAFLVATVVRYAIWPAALTAARAGNGTTKELKSWRNVLQHNMNVLFVLTEACLLSGLPVRWSHVAVAPLFGCTYLLMSWNTTHLLNSSKAAGPQFIYFFFDTTLPPSFGCTALLALLAILMFFYSLFASLEQVLEMLETLLLSKENSNHEESNNSEHEHLWLHLAFVVVTCSCVMRYRD